MEFHAYLLAFLCYKVVLAKTIRLEKGSEEKQGIISLYYIISNIKNGRNNHMEASIQVTILGGIFI